MSTARSRSSIDRRVGRPRWRSTAVASRSASSRVDDGWVRPAVTTTSFMPPPSPARRQRLVRGRVRDTGGAPRRELLAQHRNDLAEEVELLQHGLQRQARVVHQEQLALVVAEVLAERQRPVDDLLRRPDGQRRLLREVLERRPVPVHRRVVEVRPELAHRVLRVLPHEHLPAEADDRLLRRAVPVVREPLAVQADQPLEVVLGPEDVVGEEAVAVVGGLFRDLRAADGAVPHERRHAVERPRRRGERPAAACGTGPPSRRRPRATARAAARSSRWPAGCPGGCPAEPRIDRAGVARPIIRSTRPSARCCSIAKSSAIFTGSFVVISVVAVDRISFSVRAAM